MHTDLVSQKDRIDELFKLASNRPIADPIQAHLTNYLCVRICGFLERSIRHIYLEHARRHSSPTVASFVRTRLERTPNPKSTPLCQLTQEFDAQWARNLIDFLAGERKDALDSLVNNRNNIAHGESVNLGLHRLSHWYRKVIEVIEFLENQAN